MTKKIKCKSTSCSGRKAGKVKVRVIKAPIVDNDDLRNIIFSRARAVVL